MNTGTNTITMTSTGAAARVNAISPDLVSHPMRNRTTPITKTDFVNPKCMGLILPQKQACRKAWEVPEINGFSKRLTDGL